MIFNVTSVLDSPCSRCFKFELRARLESAPVIVFVVVVVAVVFVVAVMLYVTVVLYSKDISDVTYCY